MAFWTSFTKHLESWRGLPLVGLSFACCFPLHFWINVFWLSPFCFDTVGCVDFKSLHKIAYIVSFFIVAFLAKRIISLHRNGPFIITSTTIFIMGIALVLLAPASDYPVLFCVGICLAGFGGASQMLIWLELMGCIPSEMMLAAYALSLLLAEAVWAIIHASSVTMGVIIMLLLPPACMLGLLSSFAKPEAQRESLLAEPPKQILSSSFPLWRIIIWKACIGFAFAFISTRILQSSMMVTDLLLVILFLGSIVLLRDRFDFSVLYRLCLPLVILGLVITIPLGPNSLLAQILGNTGSLFALLIALIAVCNAAYRGQFSAAYPAGLLLGFNMFAIALGGKLRAFTESIDAMSGVLPSAIAIALCVVCIVISVFVFNEDRFYESWRKTSLLAEKSEECPIETLVDRLAEKAGLSSREREVALLVAQGKTNGEIATELFVSSGTVSRHISNIYAKLGIHDRKALMEQLESLCGKGASTRQR